MSSSVSQAPQHMFKNNQDRLHGARIAL
uniref:Uncharacterized protein n=1 Tax=Rhizophora mucronata TaxID=61149 RepID=A0A2P2R2X5_RHIMU